MHEAQLPPPPPPVRRRHRLCAAAVPPAATFKPPACPSLAQSDVSLETSRLGFPSSNFPLCSVQFVSFPKYWSHLNYYFSRISRGLDLYKKYNKLNAQPIHTLKNYLSSYLEWIVRWISTIDKKTKGFNVPFPCFIFFIKSVICY